MSSYGMCPYVFVYFIVHAFGLSVVAYLVVKNVILRFRPCWVYPVG